MKLKFKNQEFQEAATAAVCDVFLGQPYHDPNVYTVDPGVEKISRRDAEAQRELSPAEGAEDAEKGKNSVASAGGRYLNAPLVACLDAKAKMTTEFFIEVAKLKPGIAFFRDDAFADDSARTNLQQAFEQFSPATGIKVI